eukprot:3244199-Rhodomonas_salina.3
MAERRGEGETEDIFGRQAYSLDQEWEDNEENDEDPSVFFVLGLMEPPAEGNALSQTNDPIPVQSA